MLAATGFGILGPLARFASDLGFSAVSFATWRNVSSVVALAAILGIGLWLGRATTVRWSTVSRLERTQLAAMGIFVVGTTLGLFSAFEHITIALALIVFYTYPVVVAVIASVVFEEPLGPLRIGAIVLATAGMVLVVLTPALDAGAAAGLSIAGIAFALVAAGSQAGYALVGSHGFASVPSTQAGLFARGFALVFYAVVIIPLVVLVGDGPDLTDPLGSIEAWTLILITGVVGAALPTVLLLAGYRRVGPTRGAVLMLFEPVTGVLLAALLLAERPAPVQLLGGLLVLSGAALVQLAPARRPTAEGPARQDGSAGEG